MMPAVLAERAEEAFPDPVQRHVVVARHDDLRLRQAVEKGARLLELRLRARWVRSPETTTRSGVDVGDQREQRLEQLGVDAAEVQVGEVDEGSHRRSPQGRGGRSEGTHHDAGSRGADSVAQRRRHHGDLAVGGDAQALPPALDARSSVARIASKSRAWRKRADQRAQREQQQAPAAGPLRDVQAQLAASSPRALADREAFHPVLVVADEDERRAADAPRLPSTTRRTRGTDSGAARPASPRRRPATCRGRAASAAARGRARCRDRGRGPSC